MFDTGLLEPEQRNQTIIQSRGNVEIYPTNMAKVSIFYIENYYFSNTLLKNGH